MNYSKIYNQFIVNRKLKDPVGYFEKHHIIPKSLGGSDDESNIIKLSASDHLFAHGLLARIYKGKMIFALHRMLNGQQKRYTTLKDRIHYDFVRSNFKHSEDSKKKMSEGRKGIPAWNKGVMVTDDRKLKMSKISKKFMTKEVRTKISISVKNSMTDEHKQRLSKIAKANLTPERIEFLKNVNKGRTQSNKTKSKRSDSMKNFLSNPENEREWKKKLSEASKKKPSDETKKKMSEARKLYWEKRKAKLT